MRNIIKRSKKSIFFSILINKYKITAHTWHDDHFSGISACRVLGAKAGFKSPGVRFTHIHLD